MGLYGRGGAYPSSAANAGEDAGVSVVSREQVGPYDAAILQASDATALKAWLSTNGYDLTDAGAAALTPYVGGTYYFVALKLQQDKAVGDLRPIVLKMTGSRPCIPIRLTAIAAQPDMPIIAYVFAANRAVPSNYQHVLINESKIDWLTGGSNYPQVATAAVDEAGGHAFLTEFAGPTSSLKSSYSPLSASESWNSAQLAALSHPVDFLAGLLQQGFPRDSTIQGLLRKYVPEPASLVASVPEAQFYNSIAQYRSEIDSDPGRAPFNATGFAAELETTLIAPAVHAKQLMARMPYLTRLYTTMSAEEMTVDPEFQFNPDVPDVSNLHTAKAFPSCNTFGSGYSTVKIELEDGRYFFSESGKPSVIEGPSAQRVEQIPASGEPMVITDNTEAIDRAIKKSGGGIRASGCSTTGPELIGGLLLAVGGALRRRRRT